MQERNPIEVAAEFQAAFTTRDPQAIASLFAADATIHVAGSPDVSAVGTHHGQAGARAFFEDLIDTVTPQKMEIFDLVANNSSVVALGHFHYRLDRTGREYESDFALHLSVEHGRIKRYQMYEDSWAVAEAFAPRSTATVRGPDRNRIDYLDLDCRTGGDPDADAIVLLHGLGCTWRIWSRQIPAFAAGRRVIAINSRGSGASDLGKSEVQISDMAADVHALLSHLEIPRAVVMGLSMGGMVAMQHALDFPNDVSRLLVVGSSSGLPESLRPVADEQRRFIAEHGMADIARSRMSAAFGEDSDPELRRWAEEMIAAIDLTSYRAQSVAAFEFDARERLSELQVPVDVVHGENDKSLPLLLGQATHEGISGSKLHVIEGAGHFPNVESPKAFNDLVR